MGGLGDQLAAGDGSDKDRKEGSAFDLPMALSILGCEGAFFGKRLDQYIFLGELSLDGQVRSVRGALSASLAAREHKIKSVVVPEANAREAAVVEGIDVFAVRSLPQALDLVNAPESFAPIHVDARTMLSDAAQYPVDMRDVRGQQFFIFCEAIKRSQRRDFQIDAFAAQAARRVFWFIFEDALAGVEAGRNGHFGYVVGVDRLDQALELRRHGADVVVRDLATLLEAA